MYNFRTFYNNFFIHAAPEAVSNLAISSSRRANSKNNVTVTVTWGIPPRRNGPFNYMLNYTADQTSPYPANRSLSVFDNFVELVGDEQTYTVESLPFSDFTVSLYAYNIRRGTTIRSTVTSHIMKTLAIGE